MIRIILLLLSLTILVALHELGHYLPARWFDTKVKKFYLFFDFLFPFSTALPYSLFRVIYDAEQNSIEFFKNKAAITVYRTSHSKTETEWGIGYFPLGGYVQIAGMVDESQDQNDLEAEPQPWEFRSKKAWQRLIIMIGGVTVNFVLGVFIFAMLLWNFGKEYIPNQNVKYGISADSTAQYTGFRNGDKILSVGGKPFEKFSSRAMLSDIVINNVKTVEVERDGKRDTVTIKPEVAAVLSTQAAKDIVFIEPRGSFIVGEVVSNMGGEKAGVQKDDKIVELNGQKIYFYDEYATLCKQYKSQEVSLKVERNGSTIDIKATTDDKGRLGLRPNIYDQLGTERQSFTLLEAFPQGFSDGVGFLGNQMKAFGQMFKGNIKPSESMGGLGSMAKMFPDTWDWEAFWRMTAILSFVLAFMNLLPIPGLDGGYVMFLLYEMITGRKPNDAIVEKLTSFGLILLIALMLYANGLDVVRAWFK